MATSTIPRHVADPVFEEFEYVYIMHSNQPDVTNTFPSTHTVSNYTYTFNIARAGYKAVGVTFYQVRNDLVQYNYKEFVNFNYANQQVSLYDRVAASASSSTLLNFKARILYMKL
jgi:hypothetical protein